MSAQPDANLYQRMLGLPEDVREPDHYQLLKLDRFTSDEKAIRDAAADQNRKLMGWQNSEAHHKDARRLMLKLVEARGVLLDPQKKAAYDRQLKNDDGQTDEATATFEADQPTDDEIDWLTDDLITTFERRGRKIRPKNTQKKPKKTPQPEDDDREVFPIGSAGWDRRQKVSRRKPDRDPLLDVLEFLFRWSRKIVVFVLLLLGGLSIFGLILHGGGGQYAVMVLLLFAGIIWWLIQI